MNVKDLLLKCWQFVYSDTTVFAGKLLITHFCKVCIYVFEQELFHQEMILIKFLLDVVVIFSSVVLKLNCSAEFSYHKVKCLQLQANFAI